MGHSPYDGDIYIGTILPEVNRWTPGRAPTYRVSEWVERFQADGFDGMEVWENHALLSPPEEQVALEASARRFPVAVFSAYVTFDADGAPGRAAVADIATRLGARGVKFNLGPDIAQRPAEVERARAWRRAFAPGVRFLCECHAGTYMETPRTAAETLDMLGEGFSAIVHPFLEARGSLGAWFDHLGARVTHAHVQMRGADGQPAGLHRNPGHVREVLSVLRDRRFAGSYTLEFTEGTNTPDENAEDLYRAALADLSFLRTSWPRPTGAA